MDQTSIGTLRATWQDRKVRVRVSRPTLNRFDGLIGVVKTVNFNGHCLVQFENGQDVSWYDLAPGDLVAEQAADDLPKGT